MRVWKTFMLSCPAAATVAVIAGPVLAQTVEKNALRPTENLILWVFAIGIGAIFLSWIVIPAVFAWKNQLLELLDLVRKGQVLKVVTVLYVVLIIFTLGLLGILESDHLATLLAAIIGYVLGESTARISEQGSRQKSTDT